MADEPQLTDDERAGLFDYVDGPVPTGFAERVVAIATDIADEEPAAPKAIPIWKRRSVRNTVAVVVSLAAALVVAWIARGEMIKRDEARDRLARFAAVDIEPPVVLAQMRTDAHGLLTDHCAPCHDSADTKAEVPALITFDVRTDRWWLTMSDRQLRAVVDRMADRGMSPADIDGITSYVEAELRFRTESHT